MDPLLKLLRENAALTSAQLSKMLNLSEAEVAAKIKAYEKDQIILGYRTILNEEKLGVDRVRAVIEVKITPERGGGFDRLAERIAKYSEVHSCYLMSGGYDLLVMVEGKNLREVATFVSEKLATVQGGSQALSRSLFASLIPRDRSGEFFGFFAVVEKFAGICGRLDATHFVNAHRSISPITISILALMAITSERRCPSTIFGIAERFTNDGGRMRQRTGFDVPSDTM